MDLQDQTVLWRVSFDAPARAAPTVTEGTVYIGTHDGVVHAVSVETGEERWTFAARGRVDTAAAYSGGVVYIVAEDVTDGTARLYGIDAASGTEARATYEGASGSVRVSSPMVADGRVFAGFGDFTVRAFDAASGRVVWEEHVRSVFSPVTAPAYADGDVYAADRSGSIYRLDGATGERRWDHQLPSDNVRGSPLVVGPYVYLGFDDGTLAAFDIATGDLVWQVRLAGPVGALTPTSDLLLVPTVALDGGLLAYRHDPDRALFRQGSPTTLRLGTALVNFGLAAAGLLAGILLLFRVLLRPHRPRPAKRRLPTLRPGAR
jgi:outer membrane protein assembly factor BamB